MSEAQALANGDRIRNALAFKDLFRMIDPSKIDDVLSALMDATAAVGTSAKITAWTAFLKVFASATPGTDVDDKIAATLETIVAGPLKEILAAIIDRWLAAKSAGTIRAASAAHVGQLSLTADEEAAFQAAAIDPQMVLTIVNLLLSFWRSRK